MIYKKTEMCQMPENCFDCTELSCTLPLKQNNETIIKKKYMMKRHEDCPLVEFKVNNND